MSFLEKGIKKSTTYQVLLIEQDMQEIKFYSDLIQEVAECKIKVMDRLDDFHEWIGRNSYHLVVLAKSKAKLSSLENIKRISPSTSVILISQEANVEEAVAAIRLGAEDFLCKPFNLDSFKTAVRRGLDKNKDFGENSNASHFLHLLNSCQLIPSMLEQDKIFEIIQSFESQLRLLKAQIEATGKNVELAYVDDATGLYNTRYLNYILDREIEQSKITNKSFAILFMDADNFKLVNDLHGHLVGTKILNELGNHLKKYVREKDTVFRYGGDEFVAVLSSCDLATARAVAERIRESVEKRVFLNHEKLSIHFTISIGIALFPDHAKTKVEVMEVADHAMYKGKRATRNSVSIAGKLLM